MNSAGKFGLANLLARFEAVAAWNTRPAAPDALREALAKCTGLQSNGGNGGQPFVRVYFDKPGDQDGFYSLVSAALPASAPGERERIVTWLRSDVGKGSEDAVDYANDLADAIERGDHLPNSSETRV
jgi:hypothetical protein